MLFIVRVCAPGKIHSALVTAWCFSLSPACLRTARAAGARLQALAVCLQVLDSGAKRRNDLKLPKDLGAVSLGLLVCLLGHYCKEFLVLYSLEEPS